MIRRLKNEERPESLETRELMRPEPTVNLIMDPNVHGMLPAGQGYIHTRYGHIEICYGLASRQAGLFQA